MKTRCLNLLQESKVCHPKLLFLIHKHNLQLKKKLLMPKITDRNSRLGDKVNQSIVNRIRDQYGLRNEFGIVIRKFITVSDCGVRFSGVATLGCNSPLNFFWGHYMPKVSIKLHCSATSQTWFKQTNITTEVDLLHKKPISHYLVGQAT